MSLVDTRLKLSGLSKKNKGVKLLYERTFRNHNRRYWGNKGVVSTPLDKLKAEKKAKKIWYLQF